MRADQRAKLRALLEAEHRQLSDFSAATKADRAPVELDQQSVGRLSRMDAIQQQSMDIAREQRRQQRRRIVDAALQRLDSDDDYGYCLVCGDDIPYKRLQADPAMTRCIDCSH